jgi:hypothetical protein
MQRTVGRHLGTLLPSHFSTCQGERNRYLAEHNAEPTPFVWTASSAAILAKLERLSARTVRMSLSTLQGGWRSMPQDQPALAIKRRPLWRMALKALIDGGPGTCHFAITSVCNATTFVTSPWIGYRQVLDIRCRSKTRTARPIFFIGMAYIF